MLLLLVLVVMVVLVMMMMSDDANAMLLHVYRADSVAWSPHELMGAILQCSAILVRHEVTDCRTQWRCQGGRGSFSPLWVDVQKLCNRCVLSLSWNFFVSHDKYIARPSSQVDTQTIQPGLGDFVL